MIDWHRLFGLALSDLFTDSPYTVELEKDLSQKKQLLDVVIIEQGEGTFAGALPDGLEDLHAHNLMTYKSLRQPLDAWALDELLGHYVNYRKQASPSLDNLLPEQAFQLYAVCTRDPQKLRSAAQFTELKPGVYQVGWGLRAITIIVTGQIPETPNNAFWQLFSAIPEHVRYGKDHYCWHRHDHSSILSQLYQSYLSEGIPMSYTWDDFYRDTAQDILEHIPPEDVLKAISLEKLLSAVPVNDIEAVLEKLRQQQKHQQNN